MTKPNEQIPPAPAGLTSRQLAIWEGRSGLSAEREAAYRFSWTTRNNSGNTSGASSVRKSVVSSGLVLPCINRGEPTGSTATCPTCRGSVSLKVFDCSVHGSCTIGKRVPGVLGCCNLSCKERVVPALTTAAVTSKEGGADASPF